MFRLIIQYIRAKVIYSSNSFNFFRIFASILEFQDLSFIADIPFLYSDCTLLPANEGSIAERHRKVKVQLSFYRFCTLYKQEANIYRVLSR